jgi:hypothetical protein
MWHGSRLLHITSPSLPRSRYPCHVRIYIKAATNSQVNYRIILGGFKASFVLRPSPKSCSCIWSPLLDRVKLTFLYEWIGVKDSFGPLGAFEWKLTRYRQDPRYTGQNASVFYGVLCDISQFALTGSLPLNQILEGNQRKNRRWLERSSCTMQGKREDAGCHCRGWASPCSRWRLSSVKTSDPKVEQR